ncbi:uncharacterized protein PHALS_04638 [Plasmopara halstedii]|uniref:Uncharacterized protein n=1 Tax=Plasmopara halstedii TaxID=4781 RepID=A0A0P1A9E3_PLAHL|nr:uncharacterized protein PHALS_04638 [Plasmopara halstedii]CEG37193.1 hypothetical protein PHALS_04638 [Plasmopara halstedii]|eukprot:XP_024573562.1 hypothetical protein PHALS_04638 [Plasmopara halstedii]
MTIDPMTAVQQLQDIVTTLAPTLRPQVLPKGVTYGLDLILSLCSTEQQRRTLLALVRSQKPHGNKLSTSKYSEEDTDVEEDKNDYPKPQIIGKFDFQNRQFAVQKVQWMHEREAVVHEFARFIELQLENPAAALLMVQHFLEVNGHKSEEITLAQQCFSAAFALQTLLRAFPEFPIAIDGVVINMDENSDVAKIFAPLFDRKSKKNKGKSAQKHLAAKKVKQQQSKKRKST